MNTVIIRDVCSDHLKPHGGPHNHPNMSSTNMLYALVEVHPMLMLITNVVLILFIYDSCLFQVRSLKEASNMVALDGMSYQGHFIKVSFCAFYSI